MTTHAPPAARRKLLLDTARAQAEKIGYTNLTRDGVAAAAGLAAGTLNFYFETMAGLRAELMRQAVKERHLRIIAQGVIARHPVALRAPKELRARALTEYCK
jgi:AcrR family transcriptional regulator